MFDFFTDAIENTFDVADSFLSGEDIPKRKVAALISAGMSLYAISNLTGIAEDTLTKLLKD